MICEWCHGSGINKAVYGPVMCPDCDGTGYIDDEAREDNEQKAPADDA